MPDFDWKSFLENLSAALLDSPKFADYIADLPQEVIASRWLGYPGATEEQIQQAERRLGIALPPSYREFLKVSNGWRLTSPFIEKLWPVEEIERYITRNKDEEERAIKNPIVTSDQDYFVYGEEQVDGYYRSEYLLTALEISDWGDSAIYLLNPQVVFPNGEWEAWFLANWLPGARRYRSFREMMEAEYSDLIDTSEPVKPDLWNLY